MVTFTLWGGVGWLVACEVVEFVWLLERRCGEISGTRDLWGGFYADLWGG